jgi:hypothetical protein
MATKEEAYRGLMVRVGCFEVVGHGRFITSLLICKTPLGALLVDLPVTHLLFRDEASAFESTIAYGRLLVDMLMSRPMERSQGSRSSGNREHGERRKNRGIETLRHQNQTKPVQRGRLSMGRAVKRRV